MPDVAFFISPNMARLGFNINQKAKHFRMGLPIIHVCAADIVIPFHIGGRRNRGSSEHHGGGVVNFDLGQNWRRHFCLPVGIRRKHVFVPQ